MAVYVADEDLDSPYDEKDSGCPKLTVSFAIGGTENISKTLNFAPDIIKNVFLKLVH